LFRFRALRAVLVQPNPLVRRAAIGGLEAWNGLSAPLQAKQGRSRLLTQSAAFQILPGFCRAGLGRLSNSHSIMNSIVLEVFIVFCLLLANGVFAMAEIAVVSSRKARLQKLADEGSPSAAKALALVQAPSRFLSTVQIGITMVGILAGAFGGATISEKVAVWVAKVPALEPYSNAIAIAIVVGAITYASLIIGELVPKRIGLNNPERKAMLVAGPMNALSRIASPFVWVLMTSTELVLKVLGLGKEKDAPPSEEEVSHLIEQGAAAGVFHQGERAMVEGVLRLDETPVTEIMTRRSKIVFLNVSDPDEANWRKIVASGHSQFPGSTYQKV